MAINLILPDNVLTKCSLANRQDDASFDTDNGFQQLLQCFQQTSAEESMTCSLVSAKLGGQSFTSDPAHNKNALTQIVADSIHDPLLSVNEIAGQSVRQNDAQSDNEESNLPDIVLFTAPIIQTPHLADNEKECKPLSRIMVASNVADIDDVANQIPQADEQFTEFDVVKKDASFSGYLSSESQHANHDENMHVSAPKTIPLSGDKTAQNDMMNLSMPLSPTIYSSRIPIAITDPGWSTSFNQQIIMFNQQAIQNAEISLNPQELGSLHIKLAMHDGKMQLHMMAAYDVVKGVLEAALPQLRISLAEQGIELQHADISDFSASERGDQATMEQHANRQPQSTISSSKPDTDAMSEIPVKSPNIMTNVGLSVFV